jgi:hypothetical protein
MTDFAALVRRLVEHRVDFILIGGLAAIVHGSARSTQDVDVVYARTQANLSRLVEALADLAPYPRGAPLGLPFQWDSKTLEMGMNFTLICRFGSLDLLGHVTGGGSYEDLLPHSFVISAFDVDFPCLDLPTLIRIKQAAGRPKDLDAIAELGIIYQEQQDDRGSKD